MWGWVSRAAMSISRRNRSFPRAALRSRLSTLRATRRRCFRSSAKYTVAMPPRPSSRLMVYRSASATWSRPGTPLIQRKRYGGGRGAASLWPRRAARTPYIDERSLKAFADKLRQNAKAGELVLPGFGGVANDRLRRDLSRGGNIAFWLPPSQWSPDQSARIHAPWRRRIPYIATPTLQAPRDHVRPTPRRLLGGRRALPQGVR